MDSADVRSSCGWSMTASSLDETMIAEDATASTTDQSAFSAAVSSALHQLSRGSGNNTPASSADSGPPVIRAFDDDSMAAGGEELPCPLGEITTVMVKNIPVKCGQRRLLRQFLAAGFQGKLDFIYLPMDPRSRSSRGFAFVNFTSVKSAHQFYRIFHGNVLKNYPSETPLEVAVAEIQGFDANAEHYLLVKASRKGKGRDVFGCPTFLRPLQRHLVDSLRTLEEPGSIKSKSSDRSVEEAVPQQPALWGNHPFGPYPSQAPRTQQSYMKEVPALRTCPAMGGPAQLPIRQPPGSFLSPANPCLASPMPRKPEVSMQVEESVICHRCDRRSQQQHPFCPYCGEPRPAPGLPVSVGSSFWI